MHRTCIDGVETVQEARCSVALEKPRKNISSTTPTLAALIAYRLPGTLTNALLPTIDLASTICHLI